MFHKILIANRGEIACRVIKTAKKMGMHTVAVYSSADQHALHVQQADEAYYLGEAPVHDSYLASEKILAIAKQANADAIHPGYGFLSENADFAAACAKADICFIGPPPGAIIAMGCKSTAKKIMEKANVPLVPGYHDVDQSEATLFNAAEKIGYPVLLKATAGGGGKGMRIVNTSGEFSSALASAKREAMASFGDDKILLEKYLIGPRHIEIQIFADTQGNFVHLFERDCSIQRRHQKILEEAPAPNVSEQLRESMGNAAIKAGQAIGYVGAGTIEFLLDEHGKFYFMEMNTRLQVEHPITEMITGFDLVEWQLRVAMGEPLPCLQQDIHKRGHAFEARIYAEDPENQFLPTIGTLHHLQFPASTAHVRVDSGIQSQDEVTPYYDPMIAKLIVWDVDRSKALRRLQRALAGCQIAGLTTNISFLQRICQLPAYRNAKLSTHFIVAHAQELHGATTHDHEQVLATACLYVLLSREKLAKQKAKSSSDPHSPWHGLDGWRMNCAYQETLHFIFQQQEIAVYVDYKKTGFLLTLPHSKKLVQGQLLSWEELRATIDGKKITTTIVQNDNEISIFGYDLHYRLSLKDLTPIKSSNEMAEGQLTSPMPGTIVVVKVKVGEKVKKGDPLLIIEAMKMEHTVCAPVDGVVKEIYYGQGEQVKEGVELLAIGGANEIPHPR